MTYFSNKFEFYRNSEDDLYFTKRYSTLKLRNKFSY